VKSLITRWFGARETQEPGSAIQAIDVPPPALIFRADATLPIVDWDALEPQAPPGEDPARLDAFWTSAARTWLEHLGAHLGAAYAVSESDSFLLLSPLNGRTARGVLDYVEKTRKRVLRILEGIADESGSGKFCVLVLASEDEYYGYVSNYHYADGEYALSAGMFINHGYGHFVFVQDHLSTIEPTIAHELTHCMLQHLTIPAWLNEGIAVSTERRLAPPPGRPLYTPEEMHQKHLDYWTQTTIQEFWSGKSWRRQDDGNMLSYDLATHFVSMIANDFDAFRAFVNEADLGDGGDAAARERLGFPIEHLAEAVLGAGPWAPTPETWYEGVERGQFPRRRTGLVPRL